MKELVDHLVKEWQVIRSAPAVSIFLLGLVTVFTWQVWAWRYEGIVQNLQGTIERQKAHIASQDAFIVEYRQRLHLTPDKTRYSVMPNGELRESALKVVGEIRAYVQESESKQRQFQDSYRTQMRKVTTEEDRNRVWDQQMAQSTQTTFARMATYDKKYKISALLLRDELRRRLPESSSDEEHAFYYEHTSVIGMQEVADDLEKLARSLP